MTMTETIFVGWALVSQHVFTLCIEQYEEQIRTGKICKETEIR